MKLNLYILADYLREFVVDEHINMSIELVIDTWQLLERSSLHKLSENIIYLVKSENLQKYKNELKTVPFLLIGKMPSNFSEEIQDCNYLRLTPAVNLRHLTNLLSHAFQCYHTWQEKILWSLIMEESPQEFFEKIAEVLPNPIMWVDGSYALVLKAGKIPPVSDDIYWNRLSKEKMMNQEMMALFTTSTERRRMDHVTWFKKPELLTVTIDHGKINYGELNMSPLNTPITMGQASLLNYAGVITERYLRARRESLQSDGNSFRLFYSLLNGNQVERSEANWVLKKYSQKYEEERYLIVLNRRNYVMSHDTVQNMLHAMQKKFPQAICLAHEEKILIIVRTQEYPYKKYQELSELANILSPDSWKFGVSLPFLTLDYLSCAFYQCEAAITIGMKQKEKKETLFFYEDFFYKIMQTAENSRFVCHPFVLYLDDYDEKYGTDYVRTLHTYFNCGCKLQKAADMLELHRNTMSNRLKQISDLLKLDIQELDHIDKLFFSCGLLLSLPH